MQLIKKSGLLVVVSLVSLLVGCAAPIDPRIAGIGLCASCHPKSAKKHQKTPGGKYPKVFDRAVIYKK
jgi:hypothetical protein